MADAWTPVRDELDARLRALRPEDALVLREPPPPDPFLPPERGLFGRRRRVREPATRYVQALCRPEGYVVECVSDAFWPSTPEQQRALVEDGWHAPHRLDGYATDNFAQLFLGADRDRAADAAVRALATLGCAPATAWVWDVITD
ncbi:MULTISPECIES: TY-Chap domain-containing protein [unclassified Isoptericola]|uniref:TY-Chap domain-containing protein n=1 Tax=unclassified Isoptericola TaxID=2623355 RepID=UPI00364882DF